MLPLVDKPLIQYAVEEAVAAGCTDVIIVTGRGKTTMEDHFDRSPELEAALRAKGRMDLLKIACSVSSLARISYVRQPEALGLGHAVLMAKQLVGDEPFAVSCPMTLWMPKADAWHRWSEPSTRRNPASLAPRLWKAMRFRCMAASTAMTFPRNPQLVAVNNLVEKPKPQEAPSQNAIIGRYILTPKSSR